MFETHHLESLDGNKAELPRSEDGRKTHTAPPAAAGGGNVAG